MTEALLQAVLSGLCVGGAYALVALGFSVTFTTTKTLNFSHGEFVTAGAFIGMSVLFLAVGRPLTATSFGDAEPGGAAQLMALVGALGVMGLLGWLLRRERDPFVAEQILAVLHILEARPDDAVRKRAWRLVGHRDPEISAIAKRLYGT